MSEPIDLSRRIQEAIKPQQPRGSGYAINMPDGKGGMSQVPVELATVLMLDQLVTVMREVLGELRSRWGIVDE